MYIVLCINIDESIEKEDCFIFDNDYQANECYDIMKLVYDNVSIIEKEVNSEPPPIYTYYICNMDFNNLREPYYYTRYSLKPYENYQSYRTYPKIRDGILLGSEIMCWSDISNKDAYSQCMAIYNEYPELVEVKTIHGRIYRVLPEKIVDEKLIVDNMVIFVKTGKCVSMKPELNQSYFGVACSG